MDWIVNDKKLGKMSSFYNKYFRDFGELLTDMERNGILLDDKHLQDAEIRATEERAQMLKVSAFFLFYLFLICTDLNVTE